MSDFLQKQAAARVLIVRRTVVGTSAMAAIGGMLLGVAGCGSNLRPTVTPITGTGPGSQPPANAFVISVPTPTGTGTVNKGVATIIDYSGDTISAAAPIGPAPFTYTINGGGNTAWTVNSDGTVSNIPLSSNLQAKYVTFSTLNPIPVAGSPGDPKGIDPIVGLFGGALGLYAIDVTLDATQTHSQIDVLTGSPDAFKLTVPVDETPVTMVGVGNSSRYFAISQMIPYLTPVTLDGKTVDGGVACNIDAHAVGVKGMADGIETSTYTVSSHIQVGVCPVYAVGTTDTKRVFVLNRGSDDISVINSQNNAINRCSCPPTGCVNQNGQTYTCHPSLPLVPASGKAHAGPVYAEYNQATAQLVVANYEGNSINIIDVSLDEYGNDSPTFGTTYTVPVGTNPAAVTVLADGSRAYAANQTDGTVTVVNMSSHTVEATLPVTGHPRAIVSTQNSLYGKVYVGATDSPFITIIRTDQDIIGTTVLVQGDTLDVRTSTPDTSGSNVNIVSRLPGAGQPCYLPTSVISAAGAPITIMNCRAQDPTQLVQ